MTNRHFIWSVPTWESNRLNNFAISSKGVGDALQRSASSLATANNTLEESIGLVVAGNSVVQDPDVVGNALKTAALRLTSTKGELEELGEDADGAAKSITKLQTQLLNLTGGKVNIMQDADTFKSTYNILLEMSKVWNTMTQKDQMSALELMFGKRGANVGSSIIQNMADGQKAYAGALNSSGSAMAENEKVLESIQGKVSKFQASYEALSNSLIDNDFVKDIIDFGTTGLNLLDNATKFLDGIPFKIAAITTALVVLNKTSKGMTFLKGKLGLPTEKVGLGERFKNLGTSLKSWSTSTLGIVTIAIGSITLINNIIEGITKNTEELSQELLDAQRRTDEYSSKLDEIQNKLNDNNKKVIELKRVQSDNSAVKAIEKENIQLNKQREIYQLLLEDSKSVAEQKTLDLLNNEGRSTQLSRLWEDITKGNFQGAWEDWIDDFKKSAAFFGSSISQYLQGEDFSTLLNRGINFFKENPQNAVVGTPLSLFIPTKDPDNDILNQTTKDINNLEKEYRKLLDLYDTEPKNFEKNYDKVQGTISNLKNNISENIIKLQEYKENLSSSNDPEAQEKIKQITALENQYLSVMQLVQGMTGAGIIPEIEVKNVDKAKNAVDNFDATLKDLNDSMSVLSTAYDEMSEKGELSVSTIASLIESDEDWINKLDIVNGKVILNKNIIVESAKAKIAAEKANVVASKNAAIAAAREADEQIKAAKKIADATLLIINSYGAKVESGQMSDIEAEKFVSHKISSAYANLQKARDAFDKAQVDVSGFDKQIEILDALSAQLDSSDPFKNFGSNKKNDKTDYWKEQADEAIEALRHQRAMELITEEQFFKRLKELNDYYYKGRSKYISDYRSILEELFNLEREISQSKIDDIEHEIQALSKAQGTEQQRISLYRKAQSEVNQLIQKGYAYGLKENNDYLRELQNQYQQFSDEIINIYKQIVSDKINAGEEWLSHEEALDRLTGKEKLDGYNRLLSYVNKYLNEILTLEGISEDQRRALWEETYKYKLNLEEKIYSTEQANLEQSKELIDEYKDGLLEQVRNQIDDLEYQKENDKYLQQLNDEKEKLSEQLNTLKEINEEKREEINLAKAKEAFDNAIRNKNKRILTENGFVYSNDIQEVQNTRDNYLETYGDYQEKQLQDQIDKLDELITVREEFYDKQIEPLEKFLKQQEHLIEVANRGIAISYEELMNKLAGLGLLTPENIEDVKNFTDQFNTGYKTANKVSKPFKRGTNVKTNVSTSSIFDLINKMEAKTHAFENMIKNSPIPNINIPQVKNPAVQKNIGITFNGGINLHGVQDVEKLAKEVSERFCNALSIELDKAIYSK